MRKANNTLLLPPQLLIQVLYSTSGVPTGTSIEYLIIVCFPFFVLVFDLKSILPSKSNPQIFTLEVHFYVEDLVLQDSLFSKTLAPVIGQDPGGL